MFDVQVFCIFWICPPHHYWERCVKFSSYDFGFFNYGFVYFFSLLVFSYIYIIYIKARSEVSNLFGMGTCFVEDNFSMDPGLGVGGGEGDDGSGIKVSEGEPWGGADVASLPPQLLTTCCAARVLTGRRPILAVQGLGVPGQDYNTHLGL